MSDPFAAATELCEWTGMPVPDDLARIQALLDSASAAIRRFTGQTLSEVTSDIVTLEPVNGDTLILPQRPVTAITALTVLGIAYTNYRFKSNGLIHNGATPTTSEGAFWSNGATVTYSHGYAETSDEFKDIKAICLEMADRALRSPEAPSSFEPSEETIGWRTRLFLDEQQKSRLLNLGGIPIG
jgi:hypothetical protein